MVNEGLHGPGKPEFLFLLNETVRVRANPTDFTLSDEITPNHLRTARQRHEMV